MENKSDNVLNLLSSRELEIAKLLACGSTNTMIAKELSISKLTVKAHVLSIYLKLNVKTRAQLAYIIGYKN